MRLMSAFHSVRSLGGVCRCSWRATTFVRPADSSISGHSYRLGIVRFSMTQSGRTLQNMLILRLMSLPTGPSARRTMMFGAMPMPCSSLQECCAGLDLYSSEPEM